MIDVKALRLGNIVIATLATPNSDTMKITGQVTQIDQGAVWLNDVRFSLSSIGGIPLTNEWLERCGLSFYEQDNELLPMVAMKHNGQVVAVFTKTAPSKYVHQLQNLYFALTGQELTIKV